MVRIIYYLAIFVLVVGCTVIEPIGDVDFVLTEDNVDILFIKPDTMKIDYCITERYGFYNEEIDVEITTHYVDSLGERFSNTEIQSIDLSGFEGNYRLNVGTRFDESYFGINLDFEELKENKYACQNYYEVVSFENVKPYRVEMNVNPKRSVLETSYRNNEVNIFYPLFIEQKPDDYDGKFFVESIAGFDRLSEAVSDDYYYAIYERYDDIILIHYQTKKGNQIYDWQTDDLRDSWIKIKTIDGQEHDVFFSLSPAITETKIVRMGESTRIYDIEFHAISVENDVLRIRINDTTSNIGLNQSARILLDNEEILHIEFRDHTLHGNKVIALIDVYLESQKTQIYRWNYEGDLITAWSRTMDAIRVAEHYLIHYPAD